MKLREFNVRRDPQCPVCGQSPTITEAVDYEKFCGTRNDAAAAISVSDLKRKIDNGDAVVIVDVREPFEYEIAHLENSKLIPLSDLPDHVDELDRAKEIVALCHTGTRSALAVDFLKGAGFEKTFNLAGGINAWAEEIDPTMQKY
jgi:sulfur-carrier protein adenylyltransferase/sulfurtransferase